MLSFYSTNEQTSWTVFLSVRIDIYLIAICLIARYDERHKWLMCCSIDRVLSKKTPMFFTCGFNKMFFPPIWIDSALVRFMVWREPTSYASVFFIIYLELVTEHPSLHRQKTILKI